MKKDKVYDWAEVETTPTDTRSLAHERIKRNNEILFSGTTAREVREMERKSYEG